MYNDVMKLISYVENVDVYGITHRVESAKVVFCQVKSITQSEFYQAQAAGLKPEIKFVIADYFDYGNEKEIEYEEKRYSVLRTYRVDNTLEIVAYGMDV